MDKAEKLEAYFKKESPFKEALASIRTILNETDLQETWKWNFPCYTLNGRNVIGLGLFKNHFGLWFFQGYFLTDTKGLLRNAQEGKTKAMRSLHYESSSEVDEYIVRQYVNEAIANSLAGKEVKPVRAVKHVTLPEELKSHLKKDRLLKQSFDSLTPGKQREFATHIGSAKQESTRLRRLQKCVPMIIAGVGLHDKYKNC